MATDAQQPCWADAILTDNGSVAALKGYEQRSTCQEFVARIEGVCASGVKPAITPVIRFAVVEAQVVAAVAAALSDLMHRCFPI